GRLGVGKRAFVADLCARYIPLTPALTVRTPLTSVSSDLDAIERKVNQRLPGVGKPAYSANGTLAQRRAQRKEQMNQPVLIGLSFLALAACTPQPSSQPGAGTQPTYAAGSPSNTTGAFDGTYASVGIQNISQGNTLSVAGGNAPITCQDYRNPQPITINN